MDSRHVESYKCPRCGHEMSIEKTELEEECGILYRTEYSCPHCGLFLDGCECHEEEKKDYPYYNRDLKVRVGVIKGIPCPLCGCNLEIDSNEMASNIDCSIPIDDDVMVTIEHCPHCGYYMEVVETPRNADKDGFEYFKNSK